MYYAAKAIKMLIKKPYNYSATYQKFKNGYCLTESLHALMQPMLPQSIQVR